MAIYAVWLEQHEKVHGGSSEALHAHHLEAVAWPVPQTSMNRDMTCTGEGRPGRVAAGWL